MSEDLSQKIAQISELLNQEGMAENIKGLIGMLSNSIDSQPEEPKASEDDIEKADAGSNEYRFKEAKKSRELEENIETMRQVQKVMEVMRSSNNDPRLNLLNAIRPYLNNSRQKKVGNAMRLLQMTAVTKLMDKDGKSILKL